MTIRTEVFHVDDTPVSLQAEISQQYREIFPHVSEHGVDRQGIEWQGGLYRVLVWKDEQWGGIVEISPRKIAIGAQLVSVGGVGGVMTLATMRGFGLGKVVMQRAIEFICTELQANMGMLYCADSLIPFYQKLGWQLMMQRPFVFHQADGIRTLPDKHNVMIYLCDNFEIPAGEVDVKGKLW